MSFLDWVNKAQAQQAAADVPYHLLQFQSAHDNAASENMLIQGDNLLALKALLPFYRGKMKCIFIDPPYNTQSAFEHYDDKLEHSRWLSMMTPRLVLLRELLAYRFKKHYYPVIHDLREKRKDDKPAEEFVCARAIDMHSKVKHWVRNVEREERFSFWLPTSTDYFYPDFVAELDDGRILAVEYKGELQVESDTREKVQVGQQWEKSSGGCCLFLLAVEDANGADVGQQIAAKIAQG